MRSTPGPGAGGGLSRGGIPPRRALQGVAECPSQGSRKPRPSAVTVTDPCWWAALPRGTDPLTHTSSQPGHQTPPSPAAPSPDPQIVACTPSSWCPDPTSQRALHPSRCPRRVCVTLLIGGRIRPQGCSGVGLLKRSPGGQQPHPGACSAAWSQLVAKSILADQKKKKSPQRDFKAVDANTRTGAGCWRSRG